MSIRWYLVAAFGPNEAAPRWPFLIPLGIGLACCTPRIWLLARDIATRKAAA